MIFISIILCLLGAHTYNSSSETTYPHCVRMYNIYRSEHLGTGILTLQLKKFEEKRVPPRQFNRPSGYIYTSLRKIR